MQGSNLLSEGWAGVDLFFCLAPILLACAWGAPVAIRLFANRPMRYPGDISFGLYLWHMPIFLVILPHLPEAWSPAARFRSLLVIVFPLSMVVAQISHRYIEQPFLRRKPAHRQ